MDRRGRANATAAPKISAVPPSNRLSAVFGNLPGLGRSGSNQSNQSNSNNSSGRQSAETSADSADLPTDSAQDTGIVPALGDTYDVVPASSLSAEEPLGVNDDKFISSLLEPGDALKLAKWIECARVKAQGKMKWQKRLVVVTRFRWYTIAASMLKRLAVDLNTHIFETEILGSGEENPEDLRIVFRENTGTIGTIYMRGKNTVDVAHGILSSYVRVSAGLAEAAVEHPYKLQVSLDPRTLPPVDVQPHFYKLYEAMCHLWKVPVGQAFATFYQQVTNQGIRSMELSKCPGVEPCSPSLALPLHPVLSAMSFNPEFHGFVMKNIIVPDGLDVGSLVRYSTNLTKVVLTDLSGSPDWMTFAQALTTNRQHRVTILDLSGNLLPERASATLFTAFRTFPHSLTVLRLARCGLKPKNMLVLFDCLKGALPVSMRLLEVDLSGNQFGEEGSRAMSAWLHAMGSDSLLHRLLVANSALDVGQLVTASLGSLPWLTVLDIKGSIMYEAGVQVLSVILERTSSLSVVRASDCKFLTHEGIRTLFIVMQRNPSLFRCELDFAGTVAPAQTASAFLSSDLWDLGGRSFSLRSLDVSRCALGAEALVKLIQTIKSYCVDLLRLSIGANCDFRRDPEGCEAVVDALVSFFAPGTTVTSLSIAGTKTFRLGPILYKFFHYLRGDTVLKVLDFSGNEVGEMAFLYMTGSLRDNFTLHELCIDRNLIAANGFMSLRDALFENGTVRSLERSRDDFEQIRSALPPSRVPVLKQVLRDIRARIEFNLARFLLSQQAKVSDDTERAPGDPSPSWWPLAADLDHVDPGPTTIPLYTRATGSSIDPDSQYGTVADEPDSESVARERTKRVSAMGSGLAPGEISVSELHFGREIGRGSYGVVFAGKWRGGSVAIKQLLLPANEALPDEIDKFKAEAEVMRALRPAPHVVQFLGYTLAPRLCIVTEFLKNRSLRELLDSGAEIPPLNDLSGGIASGLLHLHREMLVHGDLAARNVLVGDSSIKLADFGQTRRLIGSEETAATNSKVAGPLKWMAPESISHQKFSPRSDVWSLGVTIFEYLSRELPYPTLTALQAAVQVTNHNLRLKAPAGSVPILARIMDMCLRTDPDDRPTTATIVDMLQKADDNEWIPAANPDGPSHVESSAVDPS